jgi:hypothetical protein
MLGLIGDHVATDDLALASARHGAEPVNLWDGFFAL